LQQLVQRFLTVPPLATALLPASVHSPRTLSGSGPKRESSPPFAPDNCSDSPGGSLHSSEILDGVGQPEEYPRQDYELPGSDDQPRPFMATSDVERIESEGTCTIARCQSVPLSHFL
jgi:hypothetical protein